MSNSEERKWKVYMHVVPKEVSGYKHDKYYIGITQQSLNKRWQHGAGYHRCSLFRKAIDKYGWDNIEHLVIAEDLIEKEAKDMEVELIAKYNSYNSKYGYNLTKGGDGTVGRMKTEEEKEMHRRLSLEICSRPGYVHPNKGKKMSEEFCRNVSEAQKRRYADPNYINPRKGIPMSEENKEKLRKPRPQISGKNSPTAKIIYQYDLDMNLIKEYLCAKDASKETGIKYGNIINACNQITKTAGGFIWKYKYDKPKRRKYTVDNSKSVMQYDLKGNFIKEYESAEEARRMTGISSTNIRSTCRGEQKSCGGYLWKFSNDKSNVVYSPVDDRKMVAQYDKSGDLIAIFESGAEAHRKTGVGGSQISQCCNGKSKSAGGYIWKFYNPDSELLEKAE